MTEENRQHSPDDTDEADAALNEELLALDTVGGAMSETLRRRAQDDQPASMRIASAEGITTLEGLGDDDESRRAAKWISVRLQAIPPVG